MKCHLIPERTIVVQSSNLSDVVNGSSSSSSSFQPLHPTKLNDNLLDEGSLLLVKVNKEEITTKVDSNDNEDESDNSMKWKEQLISSADICTSSSDVDDNSGNSEVVIPLGKILEVFGPISKPLYTVRLLLLNSKPKPSPNAAAGAGTAKEAPKEDSNIAIDNNTPQSTKNLSSSDNSHSINTTSEGRKELIANGDQTSEKETKVSSTQSAHSGQSSTNDSLVDPWSEKGVLTKWIYSNPKLEVYYATNQVKFVDTQIVARNSRKGCGKCAN